ncbi:MAG: hypothetical protein ACK4YV_14800 [Emticicia sp.]
MEIIDEVEIEIFYTIERIKSIEQAVLRHQNLDEPNSFMIEQYQELKKKLSEDLVVLLRKATNLNLQIAA